MKWIIAIAILFSCNVANADDYVHGYTRSNGTYVEPYYKTSPNSTTFDNYSTQGNVNPYTGEAGTKNPHGSSGSSTYGLYGSQSSGFGSKRW